MWIKKILHKEPAQYTAEQVRNLNKYGVLITKEELANDLLKHIQEDIANFAEGETTIPHAIYEVLPEVTPLLDSVILSYLKKFKFNYELVESSDNIKILIVKWDE